MTVSIRDSKTPVSIEKIRAVEVKLSIQFPEEYKAFLIRHNGGRPSPSVFRMKDLRGAYSDSCVDWFLAIYDGEHNNSETYLSIYKNDSPRVPAEIIPIAHDPGGNLVCIAVSGQHRGAIYFWDHEQEADIGGVPSYQNVHLVADSFDEFLGSLSDSV